MAVSGSTFPIADNITGTDLIVATATFTGASGCRLAARVSDREQPCRASNVIIAAVNVHAEIDAAQDLSLGEDSHLCSEAFLN